MKVMITGCQGNLGSRLVPYLEERGIQCIGVDAGFFQTGVLGVVKDPVLVTNDARQLEDKHFHDVEAVIHLAAISNDPLNQLASNLVYDPTRTYTRKISEICKQRGIRFIFPSSCSVYGVGSNDLLTEDDEIKPQTGYSLNKVQIEDDLRALGDNTFRPIALRLATVFGYSPRMRFDVVINMFVGMALTEGRIMLNSNGQAWRPHLYIDDACEAFYQSLMTSSLDSGLNVMNIGRNDNNLRIIDIVEMMKTICPQLKVSFMNQEDSDETDLVRDRKIQDGVDKRTYKVDFSKIPNILPKCEIKVSVYDGIERLMTNLNALSFNQKIFKSRCFYRLQQLEYLHKQKLVNDELAWCV
ncbi:MAG: hypothetical protein CMF41_02470 [Legionellales bacterium]|nr:hypothetical protein [Legionellales bacterium]